MHEDSLADRHGSERAFHDRVAGTGRQRAAAFYAAGALDEANDHFWEAVASHTDCVGLELGCGSGFSVHHLRDASMTMILTDVSRGMCTEAAITARGEPSARSIHVVQTAAESLPLASGKVGLVFGHGVLHHVDLVRTQAELLSVLDEGGRAVFLEPLGHNPLLKLYRRLTPGDRTDDERPLSMEDLSRFAAGFSNARHEEFGFTTLLLVALRVVARRPRLWPGLLRALQVLDRGLARAFPSLTRWYWVSVIQLTR